MARYTGPRTKIARKFREPIFGPDKSLDRKNYAPGQHGQAKKRSKLSEYGMQLQEKQKAKYTYGVLERQFKKIFHIDEVDLKAEYRCEAYEIDENLIFEYND